MARPREFDEACALDAAIGRFWQDGFEATSVRDLAHSMGITGTSLYNAFGDKRGLFRQALERYAELYTRARIRRLETNFPPKQAIRAFLAEIVEHSLDPGDRRGCFLVNSALEMPCRDPEIGAEIAERLGEIEGFFHRTVIAGQADGSITAGQDARDLARLLVAVILGIRVLARANPDRSLLESVTAPVLSLLDSRTPSRKGADR